ncbi:hypothetical protein [Umezawaea sp.]|uniref:hypothetical protein n=1 Tax=Umezawaea sp. TaxID=1955258 RepID=UPI002ED4C132
MWTVPADPGRAAWTPLARYARTSAGGDGQVSDDLGGDGRRLVGAEPRPVGVALGTGRERGDDAQVVEERPARR